LPHLCRSLPPLRRGVPPHGYSGRISLERKRFVLSFYFPGKGGGVSAPPFYRTILIMKKNVCFLLSLLVMSFLWAGAQHEGHGNPALKELF
jgi:hypothetical protein